MERSNTLAFETLAIACQPQAQTHTFSGSNTLVEGAPFPCLEKLVPAYLLGK